jgi:sodium pump decarboxylase gamma subunit
MIIEGLKLTLLGMSVVTIFLLLLILIVNISFKVLAAHTSKELADTEAAELQRRSVPVKEQNVIIAVISAAVTAHVNRRR